MKSMWRALRYDGLLPTVMVGDGKVRMSPATPDDIREMRAFVKAQRAETAPFNIVMEGTTPGDDREQAAEIVRPWSGAGATWWIEALWAVPRDEQGSQAIRKRLWQGRPRLD